MAHSRFEGFLGEAVSAEVGLVDFAVRNESNPACCIRGMPPERGGCRSSSDKRQRLCYMCQSVGGLPVDEPCVVDGFVGC